MTASLKAISKTPTIGIFAPASPMAPEDYQRAIAILEERGCSLRIPIDPCQAYGTKEFGFSCEAPLARADALHELLEDDEVEFVLASRGGYGTFQMLDSVDPAFLQANPKPVVGFSDVTPLLLYLWSETGVPTIHGPSLKSFAKVGLDPDADRSIETLFEILSGESSEIILPGQSVREGEAQGNVLAGNLTLLASSISTPWDVYFDNSILVVEDVGEKPYRIHRALTQLFQSGAFENLAALVFGSFAGCEANDGLTIDEVIEDIVVDCFRDKDIPVLTGVSVGHAAHNIAIPNGARARLSGQSLIIDNPISK